MTAGRGQRGRAAELAKSRPDEALEVASGIDDPWYQAQALSCVARFAPPDIASDAFGRSVRAAAAGKDSYCRAAVLAWPIRAAIERGEDERAAAMLATARRELPEVELFCSRAEAASLLFQAAFAGPRRLWGPLLAEITSLCPHDSHWRSARLYLTISTILAGWDGNSAMRFIDSMPPGKAQRRCRRAAAEGARARPRTFFL